MELDVNLDQQEQSGLKFYDLGRSQQPSLEEALTILEGVH